MIRLKTIFNVEIVIIIISLFQLTVMTLSYLINKKLSQKPSVQIIEYKQFSTDKFDKNYYKLKFN